MQPDNDYEVLLRRFQPRKPAVPPQLRAAEHNKFWMTAAAAAIIAATASFAVIESRVWRGEPPAARPARGTGDMASQQRGSEPQLFGVAFEVASIKMTPQQAAGPNHPSITILPPRGTSFRRTNSTVKMLVQLAYNVQDYQVSGGPDWVEFERYDIEAKSGNESTRDEVLRKIQALLAERFQLKVLRETKEGSIYELVVARGGSKLPPVEESSSPEVRIGRYAGRRTMTQLAQYLGGVVGRPVVDRTGLTGIFDIRLEFTPDFIPIGPNGPIVAPDGPSVFIALQEQLGLRLESARGPVETLTIMEAQRPSAN